MVHMMLLLQRDEEPMMIFKPLTIGDLRSSIAGVALEMAARKFHLSLMFDFSMSQLRIKS